MRTGISTKPLQNVNKSCFPDKVRLTLTKPTKQNKTEKKMEDSRISREMADASDHLLHTSHCAWLSLCVRDFILNDCYLIEIATQNNRQCNNICRQTSKPNQNKQKA